MKFYCGIYLSARDSHVGVADEPEEDGGCCVPNTTRFQSLVESARPSHLASMVKCALSPNKDRNLLALDTGDLKICQ